MLMEYMDVAGVLGVAMAVLGDEMARRGALGGARVAAPSRPLRGGPGTPDTPDTRPWAGRVLVLAGAGQNPKSAASARARGWAAARPQGADAAQNGEVLTLSFDAI